LLHVARAGTYRVPCRFDAEPAEGTALLHAGEASYEIALPSGATDCCFTDVSLERGDISLEVFLTHGTKQRGVHQAELFLQAPRPADAE
jgi:hypothetical protein